MAAVNWNMVVAFSSDLAGVDPAAQVAILEHVHRVVNVDAFGGESSPTLRLARIYLAAHMGSRAGTEDSTSSSSSSGVVLSETVGPISRTYAAPPDLAQALQSTTFGRDYEALVQSTSGCRGPFVPGM